MVQKRHPLLLLLLRWRRSSCSLSVLPLLGRKLWTKCWSALQVSRVSSNNTFAIVNNMVNLNKCAIEPLRGAIFGITCATITSITNKQVNQTYKLSHAQSIACVATALYGNFWKEMQRVRCRRINIVCKVDTITAVSNSPERKSSSSSSSDGNKELIDDGELVFITRKTWKRIVAFKLAWLTPGVTQELGHSCFPLRGAHSFDGFLLIIFNSSFVPKDA